MAQDIRKVTDKFPDGSTLQYWADKWGNPVNQAPVVPGELYSEMETTDIKWWEALLVLPFLLIVLTVMCVCRPKGGW